MKKSKERTSLKITDFFLSNDVSPIFDNFDKNKSIPKDKEQENDKQNLNENYLNLNEDEDESNIFLNNHQQKFQINNKNKKKKLEEKELDNNNHINKSLSYFININSNLPMDKKRKLILLDLSNNKLLSLHQINLKQNNFINPQEFNSAFPHQFCKLININDIVYITGGKLNDELSKLNYNNNLGQKKCYKMIYNKDKKEIEIDKMPSSIYEHQSHSLIYLKKFDTIVMCSGHKQKNCEYFNLKENEWKPLYNLQKPRENALALVYNEKYIFLIGGKNQEGIINEDYDVIDFEIFLSNKMQNYWKTYNFKNRILLEKLGCGIIHNKNDVYIIGGYSAKNGISSWKINFERDEDDNSMTFIKEKFDKIYKISSVDTCDKLNNYLKKHNNNNLCYVGQQYFSNCDGFLFNISLGGQLTIIPENLL